jgi:hypothetical protein
MRRYIREWDAKKAGKKDGRKGHPPPEFDGSNGRYSDFEKQVSDVAERDISRVVGRWRSEETQVLKELKTLVPELHVSFRRFQNQLEVHRQRFGRDVAPEPPHRYGKAFLILLVLLFLFEGGVNIWTFRFLREPGTTTVFIGLALAALIPLAGFRIGRVLKGREKPLEWLLAIFLFVCAVLLIVIVAHGRKIGIEVRKLDPRVVEETFWIFLLMNAVFFGIALWDGYASGYTHPRLQKAYEELRRRKRQYENRIARLNHAFIRAITETRGILSAAQSLSVAYREANRRARGNVPTNELPEYFKRDFELPVQLPPEIAQYLGEKDPVSSYRSTLMNDEAVRDGRRLISQIDNALESVRP